MNQSSLSEGGFVRPLQRFGSRGKIVDDKSHSCKGETNQRLPVEAVDQPLKTLIGTERREEGNHE
jgi:hypothetical protein